MPHPGLCEYSQLLRPEFVAEWFPHHYCPPTGARLLLEFSMGKKKGEKAIKIIALQSLLSEESFYTTTKD